VKGENKDEEKETFSEKVIEEREVQERGEG
jgi:hypothetical protein